VSVTYEITTVVEPELVERYERFMRATHIPELLATGCFHGAAFTRSEQGRYRIRYEAPTEDALERYLAEHAARLRDHFTATFPRGITVSREVWLAVETWATD
jgi:Domain of unknown function (DUF4286)